MKKTNVLNDQTDMLQTVSVGIILVLLLTTRISLTIGIKVGQTTNEKVPVQTSKGQRSSAFLRNGVPTNVDAKLSSTNVDMKRQTINEKIVPNSKKHFRNLRNGISKNQTFSFLLDSDEKTKYKSRSPMEDKDIYQTTMNHQSTASNLITNNDIQVLQKFVKKLKNTATTKEKVQAVNIPTPESTQVSNNNIFSESHSHLRKTSNGHLADDVNIQPKAPSIEENKVKSSFNENNPPVAMPNPRSPKERAVKHPPRNILSSMSKSDIDAMLSVAKEWNRLHSKDDERRQNKNKAKHSDDKNDLLITVNTHKSRFAGSQNKNSKNTNALRGKDLHETQF